MADISKSWIRVCPLQHIPNDKALDLNINGQKLILARCGEVVSVLQGFCSHMLFPLAGSAINECALTCALHHSKFDIHDGSVVDWSTYPPLVGKALASIREHKALRTFETRVAEGAVYVLWATDDPTSVHVRV